MKKRLLTSLLAICLLVGLIPAAAAASGWMSECKPYQYTEVTEYLPKGGKTFTIGGQSFNEGYVFYLWNAARTSQVLYNLKGKYSSFTFYAGHVDGTKQYSAQLEIYLDGTLSKTVPLTPNDIDKEVTVDTDGVQSLKIKMTSNEALNHYDITYGVYNGTFTRNGTAADDIPESNMVGNCEPYEFAGDSKNKVIRSAERQEIFMGGDSYTDCLQFYLWNPSRTSQAKFNFGGKYESISFLVGHIDNTSRCPVTFEFAADNKVVKKLDLEPDDLPVPVTLSLSGVKQMIISVFSSQALNTYDYYYGLGAIQLTGDGIGADPGPVSVTGVDLSQSALTLAVGGSANLTATVSPSNAADKSVTWTSSKNAVARVDGNGRVTAVAAGTADITATTADGGYTATCRVTVKADAVKVTGVTVSRSSLTLAVGGSASLTATVSPSNAADKSVIWTSSKDAVARVDANGRVTAVAAGTADITATTADGGYTAACRVTVKADAVKVTGVTVSKSALTLAVGGSANLTATVSPSNAADKSVTWTSNNPAAVSVDANGRVTALAAGAAEIVVRTADGGFTAICRVIVKGEDKPAPAEVHFPRMNVYNQGQFTDVPANQWYTDGVKQAFEFGLMKGTSAKKFDPQGSVTVAQAITMASRIHSIYTTGGENFVQGRVWYQVYLDYAFQNGVISYAYYNSDVTKKATRAQFAEIFAGALPEEALSPANDVDDGAIPDVSMSAAYAAAAYKLYRAGILAGNDVTGTFSPDSYITRQEAATIVTRMAESSSRKSFTL